MVMNPKGSFDQVVSERICNDLNAADKQSQPIAKRVKAREDLLAELGLLDVAPRFADRGKR